MNADLPIRFSHYYLKFGDAIRSGSKVKLLQVFKVPVASLSKEFIDFDTAYYDDAAREVRYYSLPKEGEVLVLFFEASKEFAFCTIRPRNPNKQIYYENNIGTFFEVVINEG